MAYSCLGMLSINKQQMTIHETTWINLIDIMLSTEKQTQKSS